MHTITPKAAPVFSIETVFRRRLIFAFSFFGLLLLALTLPGISRPLRIALDNTGAVLAPMAACFWIGKDLLAARRLRGVREETGRARAIRLACTFLALGALGDGIGAGAWSYYEMVLKQPPFPSVADIAYMAEYPMLLAAILWTPSRPISSALRLRVLLDSLVIMSCAITFSWYFLLGPAIAASKESFLGTFLSADYPIGDLVLLGCVLLLIVQERRAIPQDAARLLTSGLVCIVIADIVFGYQSLQGTYATGGIVDVFWPLSYLLIGLAATALRREKTSGEEKGDSDGAPTQVGAGEHLVIRSLLPYMLLPVVGWLVVYCVRRGGGVSESGVYIGAILLVVLVLFRQFVGILDNARLNRELQGAYRELQAAQRAIESQNRSLAEANARLEGLAMTDGMTGLVNHRVFYERLHEACARAARYTTPFALLLLDVDRFKSYNDTYGHPAGDAVLKEVARLLEQSARDTDVVARYGGEEFAMLLPLSELKGALVMAERIRASMEAHEFAHRRITVSIGVSAFAVGQETPEDLVDGADRALYEAKHAGRNRVVSAQRTIDRMPGESSASLNEA